MLWRLASAWGDSPPRNSCTTWRLNSIECVRCLAMGFLLESPVQLADSQGPYLSTPKGALQITIHCWQRSNASTAIGMTNESFRQSVVDDGDLCCHLPSVHGHAASVGTIFSACTDRWRNVHHHKV